MCKGTDVRLCTHAPHFRILNRHQELLAQDSPVFPTLGLHYRLHKDKNSKISQHGDK